MQQTAEAVAGRPGAGAVVELVFTLRGNELPVDHGYPLASAIVRLLPWAHGDRSLGIHPILGRLIGARRLALTRGSRLVLRLPSERIAAALPIAGARLDVAGHGLRVGTPSVRTLMPAAAVESRLVVIKGYAGAGPFLERVQQELEALGVGGVAGLVRRQQRTAVEAGTGSSEEFVRRTLRIHDKEVVGYAVRVENLAAEESILLQERGIGGRRRFGCGVFEPVRDGARAR
jgi:CRISPR-associated protein Cas6